MDLRAILFDVNGTLVDIETDEARDKIYRSISRFLQYRGVMLLPEEIRDRYFRIMEEQRKGSAEPHPEFDAVAIWRTLLEEACHADAGQLALFLAELHRALSRRRLELYPGVREVLDELKATYALGVVSDAQSAYALPELRIVGLDGIFATVIVSGDYGYRKPDPRLFEAALSALDVQPDQAVYVGNDMYHDVYGAQQAGMRTVFWPTQYGRKSHRDVAADYVIHDFGQLRDAVQFLAG